MSNMLEQAIIDAAALRETAIKSAENALIDKYKNEFEDTIQKLLEEEEVTPPEASPETQEMSPETAAANAEDPTGPTLQDTPIEDPMMGADQQNKVSKVFDKIKSAFFNLDGDDDELVTINFDGLKAKPIDQSIYMPAVNNMPAETSIAPPPPLSESEDMVEIELDERYNAGHNYDSMIDENEELSEEDELEEELELDEEEIQETAPVVSNASPGLRQDAARDKQKAAEKESKAAILDAEVAKKKAAAEENNQASTAQVSSKIPKALEENEDSIELTEEELEEIEESLRVDMQNESEGYMGSHKKKEREFEAVAYAAARDTKKTKYREEKQETISDLQEKLDIEKKKNKEVEQTNEKLLKLVNNLKEQVEKINVSNAKLLYTNKALSNDSLNERQKNNIVENITKATSVSEAKTIYETLQSTVQSVKENGTPKSLSEAINRSKTPFLVRKEPANINDRMSDRMKILAGIKNLN